MKKVKLKAHAKINVGLLITGKRHDGYHEIETIFQEIDLHDTIYLEKHEPGKIVIECSHPLVPNDEKNICFRAIEKLRDASGINFGSKITIEKNIPVGAGLGGGSSNAAAVIKGANELFNLGISQETQHEIAREIGADVPFFLMGGTALATGIGDVLEPLKLPFSYYGVLIYPKIEISTSWVYKNFNFNLTKTKKIIKLAHFYNDEISFKEFFQNDLEKVVFKKFPELAKIKESLYDSGAFFASMSGSGSSIYGLFKDKASARNAKALVEDRYQAFLIQPLEKTSITRGAM
jgi:4-diphosphocytidyl-2-C-methyl-D-erythritol kinase